MRKCLLLLALCFIPAAAAIAQFVRFLPAGELGRTGEKLPLPEVTIDKRVLRLTPGGIIFDQNNRAILHQQLPAGAEVLYTRDQAGNVQRIYILTDEERVRFAKNPPPKPKPVLPAGAPAVDPGKR